MESKTNYAVVGFVVLILFTGLLSAALWMSVGFNQKSYSFYTVYMNEAATGLSEEAPVRYNGVKVGFVSKIRLNKTDPRKVEILLSIETGTPITTSTTATLISQGITGVSYIGLSAGSSDLTPLKTMPGEPYPVIPATPSLYNQLDTAVKEVSVNIERFSTQAQKVFSEENAANLRKTLANLENISAVIAKNDNHINNILTNISKVSNDFPEITKDLKKGVSAFANASKDLGKAGESVSKTMVSGRDALDKISQETLPQAIILLRRLNSISANLQKVSNDMRQNPSVIIRGTTPPKSGPGE